MQEGGEVGKVCFRSPLSVEVCQTLQYPGRTPGGQTRRERGKSLFRLQFLWEKGSGYILDAGETAAPLRNREEEKRVKKPATCGEVSI